jgi:hypothetical protein
LHQKLGKPIPEIKVIESSTEKKANVVKTTPLKVNFVGGTKLTSTGTEEKTETSTSEATPNADQEVPTEGEPIGKLTQIHS